MEINMYETLETTCALFDVFSQETGKLSSGKWLLANRQNNKVKK